MNICVFDTETTSLEKPFCYNVGYMIINTENWEVAVRREFVIEQVWHNLPLFLSAYYADKRPFYISAMRSRKIVMEKFGYVCQQMLRDFKTFEVNYAYAYNSSFDEKVFNFNCDWFKCINPFDAINIRDIRGFVHHFLIDDEYKEFCEKNSRFTDTGNYSTTAETAFQFVTKNIDFVEAHTALADCEIEAMILKNCAEAGADIEIDYKAKRTIERKTEKTLHIRTAEQIDYYFEYESIKMNKAKTEIVLK